MTQDATATPNKALGGSDSVAKWIKFDKNIIRPGDSGDSTPVELSSKALTQPVGLTSSANLNTATQTCPYAAANNQLPVKKKGKPCDFEKAIIRCEHCGSKDRTLPQVEIWSEGGVKRDNLPIVPATSNRTKSRVLEVVATYAKGRGDKITVSLEGGPGYCSSSKHPRLEIHDIDENKKLPESGVKTTATFEALSRNLTPATSDQSLFDLIYYHFFPKHAIRTYLISAESCHCHPEGDKSQGLGAFCLPVVAYPSDEYNLSLKLQPRFSRSKEKSKYDTLGGDKQQITTFSRTDTTGWGDPSKTKNTSEKTRSEAGYIQEKSREHSDSEGTYTESTFKKVDTANRTKTDVTLAGYTDEAPDGVFTAAGKSFSFTRDGNPVAAEASIETILNVVKTLSNAIEEILTFIQHWQPRVGWSFKMKYSLFSGSLEYAWGFKEYKDHTVYRSCEGSMQFTIWEGSISAQYGVELETGEDSTGAWAKFELSGDLSLSDKIKSNPDSGGFDNDPKVAGNVTGSVGLYAGVGEAADFDAHGETGLKGSAKPTGTNGFPAAKIEVRWTGVKGIVKTQAFWKLWSYSTEKVFFEEPKEPIWERVWPSAEKKDSILPSLT